MTNEDYRDLVKPLIRKTEIRQLGFTTDSPEWAILEEVIQDQYEMMRTMYTLQNAERITKPLI